MGYRANRWQKLQVHVTRTQRRSGQDSVFARRQDIICRAEDQGWQAFTTAKNIRGRNEKT